MSAYLDLILEKLSSGDPHAFVQYVAELQPGDVAKLVSEWSQSDRVLQTENLFSSLMSAKNMSVLKPNSFGRNLSYIFEYYLISKDVDVASKVKFMHFLTQVAKQLVANKDPIGASFIARIEFATDLYDSNAMPAKPIGDSKAQAAWERRATAIAELKPHLSEEERASGAAIIEECRFERHPVKAYQEDFLKYVGAEAVVPFSLLDGAMSTVSQELGFSQYEKLMPVLNAIETSIKENGYEVDLSKISESIGDLLLIFKGNDAELAGNHEVLREKGFEISYEDVGKVMISDSSRESNKISLLCKALVEKVEEKMKSAPAGDERRMTHDWDSKLKQMKDALNGVDTKGKKEFEPTPPLSALTDFSDRLARFKRIEVLVNNSGILEGRDPKKSTLARLHARLADYTGTQNENIKLINLFRSGLTRSLDSRPIVEMQKTLLQSIDSGISPKKVLSESLFNYLKFFVLPPTKERPDVTQANMLENYIGAFMRKIEIDGKVAASSEFKQQRASTLQIAQKLNTVQTGLAEKLKRPQAPRTDAAKALKTMADVPVLNKKSEGNTSALKSTTITTQNKAPSLQKKDADIPDTPVPKRSTLLGVQQRLSELQKQKIDDSAIGEKHPVSVHMPAFPHAEKAAAPGPVVEATAHLKLPEK